MNKEKILRFLHAIVNWLSLAALIGDKISPIHAVEIIALSNGAKELLLMVGDWLDDGQLNKSFSLIALGALALAGQACAIQRYETAADGAQKFTQYGVFQKVNVEGLRVSSKTGLGIKSESAETQAELVQQLTQAAVQGALQGVGKAAKP